MAALNLSSEGPSIKRSYQTVADAALPPAASASSPTYGQWALYSVAAPLVNAFQQDTGKESVLRVQSSGEGELADLVDEFSDGKIQFAFVKVKDPNTALPKSVLIAWCGEGVPERTKGYFTSHLAAVSKLLHGYHVQVTARTDSDLTPENIIRKVADSSGSKYSGDASVPYSGGNPPAVASKPVFTPTQVGGGSSGFSPLTSRSRAAQQHPQNVDEDGWGADAPQVTRSELERVVPAYQPTRVNMAELTSQPPAPSPSQVLQPPFSANGQGDVVKGGYQPIGKVDIAEIRRQAQASGSLKDDRPTVVKGSYEPVGKVDIGEIRARAQPSATATSPPPPAMSPSGTDASSEEQTKSLAERSAAFTQQERLTSLPKPKVSNRFGSGASTFTGTKAPVPGGLGSSTSSAATTTSAPQIGLASKNFADEGGKTPAQIWAEKKARQRGSSGAADTFSPTSPVTAQTSGGGAWESGYTGKKWAPVDTVKSTRTGQSTGSQVSEQRTGEEPATGEEPVASVSAMRDKFRGGAPMGAPATASRPAYDEPEDDVPPPPMDISSKPNAARGMPIPGIAQPAPPLQEEDEPERLPTPPARPPRSPTPPTPQEPGSPIRIAQPIARGAEPDIEPPEEEEDRYSPPPRVTAPVVSEPAPAPQPPAGLAGKQGVAQYDYDIAEDNELQLREGDLITNIEELDPDWHWGRSSRGEGLYPSAYVEMIADDEDGNNDEGEFAPAPAAVPTAPAAVATPAAATAAAAAQGRTATALYDYDAAEDNELSFREGDKITNVGFPDESWWEGSVRGSEVLLFPANYVELD